MLTDERVQKLKETSQGWLNYFRMASIHGKLKELDGWVRNRKVLYLAQLEEARTEKEEPGPSGG